MNTLIKNKCVTKARPSELPITGIQAMMWSQGGDLIKPALVPHCLTQFSPAPGRVPLQPLCCFSL